MKKGLMFLIIVALFIGLTGCSHHVRIQKSLIVEEHLLPRLNMSTPVAIVVEPSQHPGNIKFCKAGPTTVSADYDALTEYAAQSMTDIFIRNNVPVLDGAVKKLTVSIEEATCEQEINGLKLNTTINVTTGDALTKQFSGFQRLWSMHAIHFSVTAAVLNAVLEMYKDQDFRIYLESN